MISPISICHLQILRKYWRRNKVKCFVKSFTFIWRICYFLILCGSLLLDIICRFIQIHDYYRPETKDRMKVGVYGLFYTWKGAFNTFPTSLGCIFKTQLYSSFAQLTAKLFCIKLRFTSWCANLNNFTFILHQFK